MLFGQFVLGVYSLFFSNFWIKPCDEIENIFKGLFLLVSSEIVEKPVFCILVYFLFASRSGFFHPLFEFHDVFDREHVLILGAKMENGRRVRMYVIHMSKFFVDVFVLFVWKLDYSFKALPTSRKNVSPRLEENWSRLQCRADRRNLLRIAEFHQKLGGFATLSRLSQSQ